MEVYRYLEAKYAIAALENKELKVAMIHELNDPFDCWPSITINDETRDFFETQDSIQTLLESWTKNIGIMCFSETSTITDPVMWAHYGIKHEGVAIRYFFNDEKLHNVEYNEARPSVDAANILFHNSKMAADNQEIILNAFRLKAPNWAYEKEKRYILHLSECSPRNGMYFAPIPKEAVKEVVLGAKCGISPNYIFNTLKKNDYSDVKITRAARSESAYAMELKPCGRL
jgi:hypothetical protein